MALTKKHLIMNSLKNLLACLLLGLLVFTYSCKDDDDDQGCDWATEVQDELNALTTAGNAWAADPPIPPNARLTKMPPRIIWMNWKIMLIAPHYRGTRLNFRLKLTRHKLTLITFNAKASY
jgi:hypothetical protein